VYLHISFLRTNSDYYPENIKELPHVDFVVLMCRRGDVRCVHDVSENYAAYTSTVDPEYGCKTFHSIRTYTKTALRHKPSESLFFKMQCIICEVETIQISSFKQFFRTSDSTEHRSTLGYTFFFLHKKGDHFFQRKDNPRVICKCSRSNLKASCHILELFS
jgi:hypothetical protein